MKKEETKPVVPIKDLFPKKILIIPIKGNPLFPGIISPISIDFDSVLKYLNSLNGEANFLGVVALKNDSLTEIDISNMYTCGTLVKVIKSIKLPEEKGLNLLVNSLKRFKVKKFEMQANNTVMAEVEYWKEQLISDFKDDDYFQVKALTQEILNNLRILSQNNIFMMEQVKLTLANIDEPAKIGDFAINLIKVDKEDYQDILECFNLIERLQKILKFLKDEVKLLEIQENIKKSTQKEMQQKQREYFLREQLKIIKKELGITNEKSKAYSYKKKLKSIKMSEEEKSYIEKEIDRFERLEADQNSAEYYLLHNYLETVFQVPWGKYTRERSNIESLEKILNQEHYGLEDVKLRILEFFSIRSFQKLQKIEKNPPKGSSRICFVGPPGVGKTSLAKSIAKALNRKFYRIPLGGLRDETEIKGHRRTYIGSMPGKIIQGLIQCQSSNPVFLLDEVDKMSSASYLSDPKNSLLELLDPQQNSHFIDHYLSIGVDLSQVLFITTANSLEGIPYPLLDRMEIIQLSGYLEEEKVKIAKDYLLPKEMKAVSLSKKQMKVNEENLQKLIQYYTFENGIRDLERLIQKLCRKRVFEIVKEQKYEVEIQEEDFRKYLDAPIYKRGLEDYQKSSHVIGIAHGLAWTEKGGKLLNIESILFKGKENLKLTGNLGEVMLESANIAYHYIRKFLERKFDSNFFESHTIHVHIPAGAIPKDGPSAGITMVTSMLSLLLNKKVDPPICMTGEISLLGFVLPIGGVKEKLIAVKQNKFSKVLLPEKNKDDVEKLSPQLLKGLEIYYIKKYEEALSIIFKDFKEEDIKG